MIVKILQKHGFLSRHFYLYTIIGISGVALDFIIYVALVKFLNVSPVIANFISISIAICNNFWLNKTYNFKVTDHLLKRFLFFYIVGLLGIFASEILLIIFHYIAGFNDVLAKLLTLPFVLILQFILNKRFSFGSMDKHMKSLNKLLYHWPAYIIALFFMVCSLAFVTHIPANFGIYRLAAAPDENAHYEFNVRYILEHKKLPVSGRDDIQAYKSCRDNPSAQVPCLYSYEFYPATSYIIDALSAGLIPKIANITPQVAARLPATLYGIIFVLCCYFIAFIISRRRYIASLLALSIGLLPQFIFVMSYTNLDAHSVAISGLLGLALTLFVLQPLNKKYIAFLGIAAAGLLPLAKYNFFILDLPVIATMIYLFYKKQIAILQIKMLLLWSIGSFLVISSFWYIRNAILYHDPLGQSFALHEMAKYHSLGQAMPLNQYSLSSFANMHFFDILFRSFYVAFGEMFYYLEDYKYTVPALLTVLSIVILVTVIAEHTRNYKRLLIAGIAYGVMLILTVGQVLYNSLVYDFQPQGRYLFPILICTVLFLAYCAKLEKRLEILSLLFLTSSLFIFINAVILFLQVYIVPS